MWLNDTATSVSKCLISDALGQEKATMCWNDHQELAKALHNSSLTQTAICGHALFTNLHEHSVHTTTITYATPLRYASCLCRCEISKNLCCRNLAVEKAVSELPTECTFCLKQFPRSSLERHQKEECQDRYTPPHTHTHTPTNTITPSFPKKEIYHTCSQP